MGGSGLVMGGSGLVMGGSGLVMSGYEWFCVVIRGYWWFLVVKGVFLIDDGWLRGGFGRFWVLVWLWVVIIG